MDHAINDDDIYIYTGGRAPKHIINAIIDHSVKVIEAEAFEGCQHLKYVNFHDKVEQVNERAFQMCPSLERINFLSSSSGVKVIKEGAFAFCNRLEDIDELCQELEFIGANAFINCSSLRHVKIPSVKVIEANAFYMCIHLIDVEFSEGLERIGECAFGGCHRLRHISIPLNDYVITDDNLFKGCENLTTVDLAGSSIHEAISSLNLESWRHEMNELIDRINLFLPCIQAEKYPYFSPGGQKAPVIRRWVGTVLCKMEHYKAEHYHCLREAAAQLELALWSINLFSLGESDDDDDSLEFKGRKATTDIECARQERRVTCGANVVIENVLPFLVLPSF